MISKNILNVHPPNLNMICFVKKCIFRLCLCIFESDTVKSDCPARIFRKMMKYLKIYIIQAQPVGLPY